MHTFPKVAATLSSLLLLLSHATADAKEAAEATANSGSSVVVKVEKAVERGAKAAASGIEHGVKAAASGVERGATAAAHGIQHGAKATARGVEHSAKATQRAASHVASKVGKSAASSTSAGR